MRALCCQPIFFAFMFECDLLCFFVVAVVNERKSQHPVLACWRCGMAFAAATHTPKQTSEVKISLEHFLKFFLLVCVYKFSENIQAETRRVYLFYD